MNPVLTICKASAGSGKTFTLAKEFLKIVLRDPQQYNKILAITFTNKATAEMKSRIMQCLVDISRGNMKGMGEVILGEFKDFDTERLKQSAGEALGFMLHDYSHLSVMTIDSFFQKIIQAFIFELKLPAGISVQIETEQVLQKAVAEVIQSYGNNNIGLNEWLKDFAYSRIEEDKNWKLSDDIRELSGELLKEDVMTKNVHYSFQDVGKLSDQVHQITTAYKEEFKQRAAAAYTLIEQHQLHKGFFSRDSIPNYLRKWMDNPDEKFFTPSMLESIFNSEKPPFTKAKTNESNTQIWFGIIQPLILNLIEFYENNREQYLTAKAIQRNLYSLALLSAVKEKMDVYRSEESSMLISDSTLLIQKITEGANTSFLYEKAGIFYKHILLDEFQDTSTLQWNNLLPLLTEILSSGKGKILIVGDAKQSIYRWRNGNMNLILNGVKQDLQHFWDEMAAETILKGNFRSLREVVGFNNHIFPLLGKISEEFFRDNYHFNMPEHPFYSVIYSADSTIQECNRSSSQNGFVEAYFPVKDKESEIEPALEYAVSTIQSLTTSQNYQYRDITLLVRTNGDAIKLASHFASLDQPIPVLSAEALLFSKQNAIILLIEAIQYIHQPNSGLYYTSFLFHYFKIHHIPFSTSHVFEDWKNRYDDDKSSLLQQFLPEFTPEMLATLQVLPIPALLRKLIKLLHLETFNDIYLQQFQDIVQNFCIKTPGVSITEFLQWWEEKSAKLSVNMPEGPNAVQILTIHKSKGLEFPVVIIPFCNWELSNARMSQYIWINTQQTAFDNIQHIPVQFKDLKETIFHQDYLKECIQQLADALNMTYVAFTRAAEQLYFCSYIPEKMDDKSLEKITNIGQMLYYSLHLQNGPGQWQQNIYQAGNIHNKEHQSKISRDIPLPQQLPLNTLEEKIKLAKQNPENDEQILGNLVHGVLAAIQHADEATAMLQRICLQQNITPELTLIARQMIDNCLQDKNLIHWFSGKYKSISERDILFQGKIYRPDKILLSPEKNILLDFKTGKPEKKHAQKISIYKEAIAASGISLTETWLVYIATNGLVSLQKV